MSYHFWLGADEGNASDADIAAWRLKHSSVIRNILGLARTSYLNALDPKGKRKFCQRILRDIRSTRPSLI